MHKYAAIHVAHWDCYNKASLDKVMQQHTTSIAGSNLTICCVSPCSLGPLQYGKLMQHYGNLYGRQQFESMLSFTLLIGFPSKKQAHAAL